MASEMTAISTNPGWSNSLGKQVRLFGLLYLIVAICGGFAQVVRLSVVEKDDAGATAANILDSEFLFRVGFSSDVIAFCTEVGLAVVLFMLFRPVSMTVALIAAVFRLAQGVALGVNMLNQFLAIFVLENGSTVGQFTEQQREELALLFMRAHEYGYFIGLVFFALSSLALGYLVLKCGFLPRAFGVLLMVFVAFGYLFDSFAAFFGVESSTLSTILIAPAAIVEITFVLWLLLRGASPSSVPATAGTGES